MIPGEYQLSEAPIEINAGREQALFVLRTRETVQSRLVRTAIPLNVTLHYASHGKKPTVCA